VDTDTNGNKVVWHGGAIDGFTVFMAYVPAEKFAVVVLANIEGAPAKAIAADILAIAGYAVAAIRGKQWGKKWGRSNLSPWSSGCVIPISLPGIS